MKMDMGQRASRLAACPYSQVEMNGKRGGETGMIWVAHSTSIALDGQADGCTSSARFSLSPFFGRAQMMTSILSVTYDYRYQ